MADACVIIALAAERDDDFIWSRLDALQTEMFMTGPVAIKFAYYGAEGALSSRPFVATRWAHDADDMAELLARARAHCVCGCFVNTGDIFEAALKETEPVQAIIIIGDRCYGDEDAVMRQAERLRARHAPDLFPAGAIRFDGVPSFGGADARRALLVQSGGRAHRGKAAGLVRGGDALRHRRRAGAGSACTQ
jgi:hypothetical protein